MRLEECNDVFLLRKAVAELFTIIDDIDTAGDIFKPEIVPYSKYVMDRVTERGSIVYSDGYGLFVRQQPPACPELCPNCKEPRNGNCVCMRNICKDCGKPVGNITFTVCDECWDKHFHPADQEQKHCTHPLLGGDNPLYDCDGDCSKCDYFKPEQPAEPQMPLSREECQKFMRAWHVTEAYSKGSDLYSWLFNAFQQWLPAHDAAIRAQTVKEFAEEIRRLKSVIKDALLDIDQNCISHATRLLENEIDG